MDNMRIGSGKFLYGGGAIVQLVPEIKRLGARPAVIGGPSSVSRVMALAGEEMRAAFSDLTVIPYTGYCSQPAGRRLAARIADEGCDVIVGVGGGKCIDLAKYVSMIARLPVVTVPTSIATCVASSSVCIMYTDEGRIDTSVSMDREVDVVVADTDIIKSQEPRLLAAGICDCLAKYPETVSNSGASDFYGATLPMYIATVNAKAIYVFLMAEGPKAYREGASYQRYDDMVLTNLLHTSLVTGFFGQGRQGVAHALYGYLRRRFTRQAEKFLHGEIVGVGLIAQLIVNDAPEEETKRYIAAMHAMNMPTTVRQLGCPLTPEDVAELKTEILQTTNVDEKTQDALLDLALSRIL